MPRDFNIILYLVLSILLNVSNLQAILLKFTLNYSKYEYDFMCFMFLD